MIIGGTFETIDVVELLVMFAIPAILIVLLVRSFRKPGTRGNADEPKAAAG